MWKIYLKVILIWAELYRDEEKHREKSIYLFTLQMANMSWATAKAGTWSRSPMWVPGHKHLAHGLLLSQAVSREWDQNWRTQE